MAPSARTRSSRSARLAGVLTSAALALTLGPLTPGAQADTRVVVDDKLADKEGAFLLSIDRASHGHRGRQLVHTIRTHKKWRSRALANGTATYYFRIGKRYRTVNVKFRDGRLRGTICSGRGLENGCSELGPQQVRRPDARTLRIVLRRGQLARNLKGYRWRVSTYASQGRLGCASFCVDETPDGGWVRHTL